MGCMISLNPCIPCEEMLSDVSDPEHSDHEIERIIEVKEKNDDEKG